MPKYFTTERLREVSRQCLETLAVLHANEVIHCDLKPENILIQSLTACQVKVIDYGNAYLHHDQRCSYVQSRAYRAPEVVLGHPYSPKVDLWSLGCILMELLTNRLLFDNRSVQSLLASHIALLGNLPARLLKDGQLSDYYFVPGAKEQVLVGKHDGRICKMRPMQTSLEALCERHGCSEPAFPAFIRTLLTLDPNERGNAEMALKHPFIVQGAGVQCPPYKLTTADRTGEAGMRLLQKYVLGAASPQRPASPRAAAIPPRRRHRRPPVPALTAPAQFRPQLLFTAAAQFRPRSAPRSAAAASRDAPRCPPPPPFLRYKSLEQVDSPSRSKSDVPFGSNSVENNATLLHDDIPGPATPTSFREQVLTWICAHLDAPHAASHRLTSPQPPHPAASSLAFSGLASALRRLFSPHIAPSRPGTFT